MFRKSNRLLCLCLFAFLFIANKLSADPAHPDTLKINQPDGTLITTVMKGDEYLSWMETTDGYVLVKNQKGVYEYAEEKNGQVQASGIKANEIRSEKEIRFIASLPEVKIKNKMNALRSDQIVTRSGSTFTESRLSSEGQQNLLCILIGFKDLPFKKTKEEFNQLFNQKGYNKNNSQGSVKDYFQEVSYEKLTLNTTVVGPFIADRELAYYGANTTKRDIRVEALLREAIQKAASQVDLSKFDNDKDGFVDNVHVVFAGYSESQKGGANTIWPGARTLSYRPEEFQGKKIQNFTLSSELRSNKGSSIAQIGTICHELLHAMGAPDYYDTDSEENGSYAGTGLWDVMCMGLWNNNGDCPAHPNGYIKSVLFDWAPLQEMEAGAETQLLPSYKDSLSFYQIPTPTANEFYLLENRQNKGFDSHLPGHGLIVYHVHPEINKSGHASNTGHPQKLYPLYAAAKKAIDGTPESYGNIDSNACPFPGTGNVNFLHDYGFSNLKSWAGENSHSCLWDIKEVNGNISFIYNPLIEGPEIIQVGETMAYQVDKALPVTSVKWTYPSSFAATENKKNMTLSLRSSKAGKEYLYADVKIKNQTIRLSKEIETATPSFSFSLKQRDEANQTVIEAETSGIYGIIGFEWIVTPQTKGAPTTYNLDAQGNKLELPNGLYNVTCRVYTPFSEAESKLQMKAKTSVTNIYPNPVSDFLYVTSPDATIRTEYTISLYDINGNLQKSFFYKGKEAGLNVASYPSGYYFLQVTVGKSGQTDVHRVLINH